MNLTQSATIVTSLATLQESAVVEDALAQDLETNVEVTHVIVHPEKMADVMIIVVTEDHQTVGVIIAKMVMKEGKNGMVVAEIEDLEAVIVVLKETEVAMIASAQEAPEEMTEGIVAEVLMRTAFVMKLRKDLLLHTVEEKTLQVINKNKNKQSFKSIDN